MARNFRKIIAWQEADNLVIEVYKLTGSFPSEERYGLTSQLRRAAMSVAANIAEGSGRSTLKDFLRFLYNAQGSLSEVEYYLHIAQRLNYLSEEEIKPVENQRTKVGRLLNGFIRSIHTKIANGETT
ncbi:MAG TPA: four helix bundle protein [Chloroflexi bacterium]|nr:four helix bundle protein [Chloroflexota bacterium]